MISAPVKSTIAPARIPTPSSNDPFICEAPSMNPFAFCMNADKSSPIFGNCEANPSANPPAMPPINLPIATPMACNKSPPPLISSLIPGICSSFPIAASTKANSAITSPTPTNEIIANGISIAIAVNATINAEIIPTILIPLTKVVVSTCFIASNTPLKNVIIRLNPALIRSGSFSASALIVEIRKSASLVTIAGPCAISISSMDSIIVTIIST